MSISKTLLVRQDVTTTTPFRIPSTTSWGSAAQPTSLYTWQPTYTNPPVSLKQKLTTIFTPATNCFAPTRYWTGDAMMLALGYVVDFYCYPYNYAETVTYSPGICPDGYTTVRSTTSMVDEYVYEGADGRVTSPLSSTEAICCPSGFSYLPDYEGRASEFLCQSGINWPPASHKTSTVTFDYVDGEWTTMATGTVSAKGYSVGTATISTAASMRARAFRVAWQSTDSAVIKLFGADSSASVARAEQQRKTTIVAATVAGGCFILMLVIGFVGAYLRLRRRRRVVVHEKQQKLVFYHQDPSDRLFDLPPIEMEVTEPAPSELPAHVPVQKAIEFTTETEGVIMTPLPRYVGVAGSEGSEMHKRFASEVVRSSSIGAKGS